MSSAQRQVFACWSFSSPDISHSIGAASRGRLQAPYHILIQTETEEPLGNSCGGNNDPNLDGSENIDAVFDDDAACAWRLMRRCMITERGLDLWCQLQRALQSCHRAFAGWIGQKPHHR